MNHYEQALVDNGKETFPFNIKKPPAEIGESSPTSGTDLDGWHVPP